MLLPISGNHHCLLHDEQVPDIPYSSHSGLDSGDNCGKCSLVFQFILLFGCCGSVQNDLFNSSLHRPHVRFPSSYWVWYQYTWKSLLSAHWLLRTAVKISRGSISQYLAELVFSTIQLREWSFWKPQEMSKTEGVTNIGSLKLQHIIIITRTYLKSRKSSERTTSIFYI